MKKLVAVLLAVLMLGCSGAYAEGLLPQFDDVFGIEVPSMANSLGREPDSSSVNEDGGQVQTFGSVTEEDYQAFSNYLTRSGCAVSDYSFDGGVLHVILSKDEIDFTLDYDIENQQAVITYPSGVRVESFNTYRVGAIVTTGRYEQDGDESNGPEPIEWIVISNENGQAILLSKYVIRCVSYIELGKNDEWENWALREWLNGDFYNNAFSTNEKDIIIQSSISNPPSPINGETDGNDTRDYVYILNLQEVCEYFNFDSQDFVGKNYWWYDNSTLVCWPTQYVIDKYSSHLFSYEKFKDDSHMQKFEDGGVHFKNYDGAIGWVLRSRFYANGNYNFVNIGYTGYVQSSGYHAGLTNIGVRPVICISVDN